MSRINQTRIGVRGEVLATFWPKHCNRWNTRHGNLFLRKWRGLRIRGKGWQWKRDGAIDEAMRLLGWKQ